MVLPMDYRAIRVWHVRGDLPGNWRELQKRAWREGAPLDALYVDYAGRWICARDLAADHWIHAALASDREHCRKGFWRAAAAKINRAGPPDEGDAVRAPFAGAQPGVTLRQPFQDRLSETPTGKDAFSRTAWVIAEEPGTLDRTH